METKSNNITQHDPIHVLSRAVIIDQGYILLCQALKYDNPFFFLPGGHVESGESASVALARELQEEAGASCSITRFLGCLEYRFAPKHPKCHTHEYNLVFEVQSVQLTVNQKLVPQEDHIQLLWVPLGELEGYDVRPWPLKRLIGGWIEGSGRDVFYSLME